MTATRIYVVSATDKPNRLVEAGSAAQAIRHCAMKEYSAKVPTTKEVAHHMACGIIVEQAIVAPEVPKAKPQSQPATSQIAIQPFIKTANQTT